MKQVIVIRRDLKMRRGKEIAQGAHASMAWLSRRVPTRTCLGIGPDYDDLIDPVTGGLELY